MQDAVEDWRIIVGYDWDYWVSSHGRVMSFKGRYPLILSNGSRSGYPVVNLLKDGMQKTFCVHRLVAEAFLDNSLGLATVNHKDGNKRNNMVENLEWASYSQNNTHAHYAGLKNQIRPVVALPIKCGVGFFFPSQSVAVQYGFHQGHISAVCLGKLLSHAGFRWEFVKNIDQSDQIRSLPNVTDRITHCTQDQQPGAGYASPLPGRGTTGQVHAGGAGLA